MRCGRRSAGRGAARLRLAGRPGALTAAGARLGAAVAGIRLISCAEPDLHRGDLHAAAPPQTPDARVRGFTAVEMALPA